MDSALRIWLEPADQAQDEYAKTGGWGAMVWDVSFTCDICGKKKGEANHWWMVMLGDVPCWEEDQPSKRFTLMPWNAAESQRSDIFHLCGQGCAMQAMERFMTNGTLGTEADEEESAASRIK